MKNVLSVNVGLPRFVEYQGEPVATAIFKSPVEGKIAIGEINLAGDRQADLSVHGGRDKSIYVYPFEHYDFGSRNCHSPICRWAFSVRTSRQADF